jgi:hypothetical protein
MYIDYPLIVDGQLFKMQNNGDLVEVVLVECPLTGTIELMEI